MIIKKIFPGILLGCLSTRKISSIDR